MRARQTARKVERSLQAGGITRHPEEAGIIKLYWTTLVSLITAKAQTKKGKLGARKVLYLRIIQFHFWVLCIRVISKRVNHPRIQELTLRTTSTIASVWTGDPVEEAFATKKCWPPEMMMTYASTSKLCQTALPTILAVNNWGRYLFRSSNASSKPQLLDISLATLHSWVTTTIALEAPRLRMNLKRPSNLCHPIAGANPVLETSTAMDSSRERHLSKRMSLTRDLPSFQKWLRHLRSCRS